MKIRIYITTVLLFVSSTVFSQIIPQGYTFLGTIKVDQPIYSSDLMVSDDAKYLVINVGAKRDDIRVFEVQGWKEIQTFDFRRALIMGGFFDKYDSNIFYLEKAGRWMHKCNIKTGKISSARRKKIRGAPDEFYTKGFASQSIIGNTFMIMLPQQFIITSEDLVLKVYVWNELLTKHNRPKQP